MDYIKLITPLITFLLGVLVALFLKRREEKDKIIRENVDTICQLSSDWYNRLIEIASRAYQEKNIANLEASLYQYTRSVLFLPAYRRSIVILKQFRAATEFTNTAEKFIINLTEVKPCVKGHFDIRNHLDTMACLPVLFQQDQASGDFKIVLHKKVRTNMPNDEVVFTMNGVEITNEESMKELHCHIQRIYIEAAKLIGKPIE